MKKSKSSRLKSENENGSAAKPDREDFLIVGVGASAGGIQALKEFFGNVPADSGAAYVVILHLSPEHESHLAEVLQTSARVSVTQVTKKVRVEPNHVYVVSPNQSLSMINGHIVVAPVKTIEERRAPVDIFFRTLAESQRERAVSVVLSGTGADGSMGLKRVKECGGVVFVQNPREAEYNDMPRNAIATNLVDRVLNVADIPAQIAAYQENRRVVVLPIEIEPPPESLQTALRDIFTQLRVRTGHDFANYKRPTILRRIERGINVRSLAGIGEYAAYLREEPEEMQALLKDLLISVTNFFRDKAAFEALEADVVPRILSGKTADDQIRVWVVGCATGEEAYSLAMMFAERTFDKLDAPAVQIFATDIDQDAITIARNGFYTLNDAADVSPERLRRFFTKQEDNDGYRIRREIREMVLFANHNIIKDPPFLRLDLATCRNMLIYLNDAAQKRVMETVHFALKPDGFFFLGSSETINGAGDLFAPLHKEYNIFQSRPTEAKIPRPISNLTRVVDASVGKTATTFAAPEMTATRASGREQIALRRHEAEERISYADLHQRLLEQFAPPSIVVNEDYDILHLSENAGRFLQIAGGEPSNNLLETVCPELRLELRAALARAAQKRINVVAEKLPVNTGDRIETINLHVRPVLRDEDAARGFVLVVFEKTENAPDVDRETISTKPEPIARLLEEELMRVRARLQMSIEQYEVQTEELKASNEEFQAMNEELRSKAEELETGKEELQSVNEELKIKIAEISQSNDDFQNLMTSSDIGTIFLDRELRVKMFTPPTRKIVNLLPADLGRPLSDIATNFAYEGITDDCELVLSRLQPVEREIETGDKRCILLRLLPYRTTEDRISGVVLTFLDITERKRREEEVRELASRIEQQARIFDTTLNGISDFAYILDRDGRFVYSNQRLLDLLGISLEEIVGKNFFDLNYPDDLAARLQKQIEQVFETREIVRDETPFVSPAGEDGFYEYIFTPVFGEDGAVETVAGSTRDVTARRQAEESLRESEERLRLATEAAQMYSWEYDATTAAYKFSENAAAILGVAEDALPRTVESTSALVHPDDLELIRRNLERAIETGEGFALDFRSIAQTGEAVWLSTQTTSVKDAAGRVRRIIGIAQNISERKRIEEALRESETRFRATFEQANVGIVQLSFDGRFLMVNPGFCQIVGYSEEEFRRLKVSDITHPDDYKLEEAETHRLSAGEISGYSLEKRFLHKSGGTVWGTMTATLISTDAGEPFYMLSIVEDITERKAAEKALRESEERLLLLVESASDYAIFSITPDNIVDSWNAGAEKVFGYQESEIIGRSGAILFTREDRQQNVPRQEIETARSEGRADDERWHIRKDGTRFLASGVMRPLMDGKVEGFVKIARDQTAKIRAEKAVRDKEILQKLVGAQEAERKRIARDLHDHLGQQLTAVRLKLEHARDMCADNKLFGDKIEEIQLAARQIDADVDFLAWELRPAALDDLGLLTALENYLKEWARHTGIKAEFYAAGLKNIRLAPEAETNLYRIAQEALNNVYKHAAAQSVNVMLERRGSLVVLIIEDDGIGFNPEDKQIKQKGIGLLGMGERAALIGGKIQIESTPQRGTTVFVRVPLENENQPE